MKRVWILLIIMSVILIFGCTTKKNTVGFTGTGVTTSFANIDHSYFNNYYSYEDTTRVSSRTKLIVGNHRFVNAYTLLQFSNLPDTLAMIQDIELILHADKGLNYTNMPIHIGLIQQSWSESYVTWNKATSDEDWDNPGEFFEPIDSLTFSVSELDTIKVNLPEEIIQNWVELDSLNYGIVLYSDEPSDSAGAYVEFDATYSSDNPRLKFSYKESIEDTIFSVYEEEASNDNFINSSVPNQTTYNKLIISNITPTKMVLNFDLPMDLFTDIDDSLDYRRMTINRAELILYSENQNNLLLDDYISLYPALLPSENPDIPVEYNEVFYSTTDSLSNNQFSIDITPIIQAYTSGDRNNYGVIIMSAYEDKDFNHVEFVTPDDESVNQEYLPKIKIEYTPPYLIDE